MNTGNAVGIGMPARERVEWAKEMVLEWIDDGLKDFIGARRAAEDVDEQDELLKQRNRVARFLGLPESRR